MDERTRTRLVQKIDRLDHPDAGLQDTILDEFSRDPEGVRPVILANLPLVNDRVRRALLRWLTRHHDARSTLPLMRYVFDERNTIAEQAGRAIAMAILHRRARQTGEPEERGRLRAFAEDLTEDLSPEIRRQALRILAFVGNERSVSFVEPRLADDDEEVRAAAHEAMNVLSEAGPDDTEEPRSAAEIQRLLLESAGPLRRQLVRQWRRHPEKADIAAAILKTGDLRTQALQVLLEEPRQEVRPSLAGIVLDAPDGPDAALALRLLTALASQDSAPALTNEEEQAIRRGLETTSVVTTGAACDAAARLRPAGAFRRLLSLTHSNNLSVCLAAAAGVDHLASRDDSERVRDMIQSIELNDRRRTEEANDPDRIKIIAYLQSALRKMVHPGLVGVETVHRLAITQLRRAGRHQPIRVTALQLLLASTPEEGLDEVWRWDERDVSRLLEVLPHCDGPALQRLGTILARCAPRGLPELTEVAREFYRSGEVDVATVIVVLLDRADSPESNALLEEISRRGDDGADAAAQVLRRRRNDADVIDAEFIPNDK